MAILTKSSNTIGTTDHEMLDSQLPKHVATWIRRTWSRPRAPSRGAGSLKFCITFAAWKRCSAPQSSIARTLIGFHMATS